MGFTDKKIYEPENKYSKHCKDAFLWFTGSVVGLEKCDIPQGVETIKDMLFFKCTSLKEVAIPEGVITLREYAFSQTPNIISIVIPNTVTTIKTRCFFSCGVHYMTIPDSVTTIERSSFVYTNNLKVVYTNTGNATSLKTKLVAAGMSDSVQVIEKSNIYE